MDCKIYRYIFCGCFVTGHVCVNSNDTSPYVGISMKKKVPWHILAPSAVACDMFLLRASAHHWHVSAFLCNREFQGISYYIKKGSHRVLFYPSHFFTFCQNFCFCLKCLICFYTLDDGRLFCAFNAFNSSNTTSFRTLM